MVGFLTILLIINAVLLTIVILLQAPKSDNAAGTLSGTGANIFAQTKERGAELVFKRMTIVLGTTFMFIPILIAVFK
jgi:preprotein translocase subunit SecG